MSDAALIRRETAVSVVINAVLSLLFFFAVFGWSGTVAAPAFARDFLPQAFMVSLMGSLVPGLLMRRHGGTNTRDVVRRATVLAIVGVTVAGGGAFLLSRLLGDAFVPMASALTIKVAFGGLLGAVVTPIAVRAALPDRKDA